MKKLLILVMSITSFGAFAATPTKENIRDAIEASLLKNDLSCLCYNNGQLISQIKPSRASVLLSSFKKDYTLRVSTDENSNHKIKLVNQMLRDRRTDEFEIIEVTTDSEAKLVEKLTYKQFGQAVKQRINNGSILNPDFDDVIVGNQYWDIVCK
ncbi:MAG: hypothetical protein ACOYL6_18485 [Bacteriovoracaceae bacterium]